MSEIKHTPGPWTLETVRTSVGICHKVGEFPSSSPSRPGTYACVYGDHINADDAYRGHPLAVELLANARLIAAAPDLLAACKMAEETFRKYGDIHAAKGTQEASFKALDNFTLADIMAAAIAKAEGL